MKTKTVTPEERRGWLLRRFNLKPGERRAIWIEKRVRSVARSLVEGDEDKIRMTLAHMVLATTYGEKSERIIHFLWWLIYDWYSNAERYENRKEFLFRVCLNARREMGKIESDPAFELEAGLLKDILMIYNQALGEAIRAERPEREHVEYADYRFSRDEIEEGIRSL